MICPVWVTPAHAQLIAYDGFDYPIPPGTPFVVLDGAAGGSATGWDMGPFSPRTSCSMLTGGHTGSGWVTSSQNVSHPVQNRVVPPGLTYPGLPTSPGAPPPLDRGAPGWN